MCYESYYRTNPILTVEQRRDGITAAAQHHRELRANVVAGVPGAEHAYREHIAMHKRQAAATSLTNQEAKSERDTLSILNGELAVARRARRKYERMLATMPDESRRAAARQRRIERRAARRSDQTVRSVEHYLADCRTCSERGQEALVTG